MRKIKLASIALCVTSLSGLAGADVIVDNQTIPSVDIQAISINPTSGGIYITTKVGYSVQKSGGTAPPPPGSVAITNFSISPTSLDVGEIISINWTTSNAVTCVAGGGTGPWQATAIALPSGTRNLTMNDEGTLNFILSCNGAQAGDLVTKSVIVNVGTGQTTEPPPVPSSCATPSLSGGVTEWDNFWGVGFPMPIYKNQILTVPKKGYQAIRFNTGNVVDNGTLLTIGTTLTGGLRLGTISECPGDFNVSNAYCKQTWGSGGTLRWSTDNTLKTCGLKPNTDYYFNVTFTNGTDPSSTTCTSSICTTEIQHNNY